MIRNICGLAAAVTLIALSAPAFALTEYVQDFESLDPDDPDALFNDEWSIFGNVFTSMGDFIRGYGPFPAPNHDAGFSGLVTDQGGDEQGGVQLNIYNDYNNVGDHEAGNLVESNVYQEQVITAGDVGSLWFFRFDAKRGNIVPPSTAIAFIKTLDPGAGFALTNFITEDTSVIPDTWGTYILSIEIDAGLVGQLLQIGFANTAKNFEPSAVFYDNITFSADIDGDGEPNNADNCQLVANAGQQDANADGFGNLCDPDVTGPGAADDDCAVNFLDLNAFKAGFFGTDPELNLDGVANVNFTDLNIVKEFFFGEPGPSSEATCP